MNFNEYKQALKREINFDNIPQFFKDKPNWVLWKLVKDNDPNAKKDYKKIPFNIDEKTGEINYKVSSNDPNTWDTFENVKKHYEALSEVAGIWFAIDDECLFFLDIDGVKDHYLIDDLSGVTYGELSPSQEGYHFFLQSSEPFNHKKKDSTNTLELYSGIGRFASFTGFSIDEDVNEVIQDDEKVKEVIKNHFETNSDEKPMIVVNFEDINNRKGKCKLSVNEILEKAKNNEVRGKDYAAIIEGRFEDARNYKGERFVDEGGVIDISRADFSLMQEIARITKGDREKMFEVYRNTPDWYRKDNDHNVGRIGNTIDTAIRKYFEKASFELPYGNELKRQLKQARDTKLKEINEYRKATMEKPQEVNRLSPLQAANLFIDTGLVKFNLFDDQENSRIGMYLSDEGIYTVNLFYIQRVISYVEESFTEKHANNVIYHLRQKLSIKKPTKDKNLIAVNNGVFNNKTKKLEPFSPDYIFTTKISTNYVDDPKPPKWDVEEWLSSIACNDEDLKTLLWQVINETLNGNHTRGKAFFLTGEGNNGKGTFQKFLTNLIGEKNYQAIKVDQFDERFITSSMVGKSLILGDDVPPNVYVDDSSVFKSIITGDPVMIEYKNKQPYTLELTPTIIQSTNGMPKFKDRTHGLLRRIQIVPFNADFNGAIEDKRIKEEYIHQKEVLEYVLHKAIQMEFDKFIQPQSTLNAMEVYKEENDPIYEFYKNVFENWKAEFIPKRFVFEGYEKFCEVYNYRALGSRKFHKDFKNYAIKDYAESTKKITPDIIADLKDDSERQDFTFHCPLDPIAYVVYENKKVSES